MVNIQYYNTVDGLKLEIMSILNIEQSAERNTCH